MTYTDGLQPLAGWNPTRPAACMGGVWRIATPAIDHLVPLSLDGVCGGIWRFLGGGGLSESTHQQEEI